MATAENYIFNMPWAEQIKYFRDKVNLPTEAWTDMWQGMHSRAFVVAGATKAELLCDLRAAVDKAISKGTTLQEFRRDFGQIVQKHGWPYKGGRDWRTRVIYETNLNTASAAGRYKQMTDPGVLKLRPYWRYRHGGSANPREEHLRFDGLILQWDDPFWQTHYPPNGWGCSCYIESLSDDDLERDGLAVQKAPEVNYYDWTNPKTGETVKVPEGVSPGWAYNVGETAWGNTARDSNKWNPMPGGLRSVPQDTLKPVKSDITLDRDILDTKEGIEAYLRQSFGGRASKVFTFDHNNFRLDLNVNATALAKHIATKGRAAYLPYLQDLIQNPQEVWLEFEKNAVSGKVRLSQRFLKYIDQDKDGGLVMSMMATKGEMVNVTFIPQAQLRYLNKQRKGLLVYKKK